MFKITAITSLLFVTLSLAWALCFGFVSPADITAYHTQQQQQDYASVKGLAHTTTQNRKSVVKEIYFSQEDHSRLHYRIESDASVLTLKPEGAKCNLIEKLEKMRCWMQDKLESSPKDQQPMQHMRYLEAEEGIYRYTAQQFLAQSVALSLYHIDGHNLPSSLTGVQPFLNGIAQDISFTVTGKTPQFQAQNFKALAYYKQDR